MKWLLFAALAVASLDWGQASSMAVLIPMENSFYELECPHPGDFQYWLLHGEGTALYPESLTYEELTIYVNGSMIFKSIRLEHAGVHLCLRKDEGIVTAHPVPLKVRPLPSTDLWNDIYQPKFLTGLVAALVCLSLFALSCLVYNNRWRSVEKDSDVSPIIENGYDNPVMVGAEEDASSTKM